MVDEEWSVTHSVSRPAAQVFGGNQQCVEGGAAAAQRLLAVPHRQQQRILRQRAALLPQFQLWDTQWIEQVFPVSFQLQKQVGRIRRWPVLPDENIAHRDGVYVIILWVCSLKVQWFSNTHTVLLSPPLRQSYLTDFLFFIFNSSHGLTQSVVPCPTSNTSWSFFTKWRQNARLLLSYRKKNAVLFPRRP